MQVFDYDNKRYWAAEKDLCQLHKVADDDALIDGELKTIHTAFAKAYPRLKRKDDYEFPSWHHNLRLFWVYLYSDVFYDESFIPRIQNILSSINRSWFAEFECYSPSLESPDLPRGDIGQFLIFKDTVIFSDDEQWTTFRSRLIQTGE